MRILYVSDSWGPHDKRFAAAWKSAGCEVSAFALTPSTDDAALEREISRSRPTLVHAGPLTSAGYAVAQSWHGPMLASSWGFDLMHDAQRDPVAAAKAVRVLSAAQVVHTDNDAVTAQALRLGARPGSIVSFPWGIDHGVFGTQGHTWRDRLDLAGTVTILSVRRHEELYDVATLVRAFDLAAARAPELRLVLGGSGSQTQTLKATAAASACADRIVFVGEQSGDELAALYRTADIYVSTARTDGTSISLLEAMSSGCTPVVADIPGNRQWVTPATGLRFPVGDATSLADAITRLAHDEALRKQLSGQCQRLTRAEADWSEGPRQLRQAAEQAVTEWELAQR